VKKIFVYTYAFVFFVAWYRIFFVVYNLTKMYWYAAVKLFSFLSSTATAT